ncbi:muellerian-inhibiting factor-like [Megalops cyprinoides]|uniref:muellerian-inhibiting factor-like n=1 Tax=Megalops cyprinoides TaxID=118141 RepID=UPI001864E40E|nr:muellerian-inhibiting factor-like [Megalops cyprinoides]
MGEEGAPNGTLGPVLLFRMDKAPNSPDSRLTPERSLSTAVLAPSRTFLFLCDLQKFLSEVLPGEKLESLPVQTAPVSLDTLQSLPPLTLGDSASEPLLLGLLNSSAPTLFSFPRQLSELQEHRVELALQPPLLAMLRLRLEEAVAQMVRESVGGRDIMDRLLRLQELSVLPREGEDPPAGTQGNPREAQYRALLLLKALQTVLGAWEEERGQRAARGGQEGPGKGNVCQLHSLTVSLKKYVLNPPTTNIKNCQGACSFPLTNTNNHVILLNSHWESGFPLERPPCCVPVDYEDLQVAELDGAGTKISIKPNVVAKACGCR